MKKIMFNDKYGLTKAVLDGRKTQTRRIIKNSSNSSINCSNDGGVSLNGGGCIYPKYELGEIVAVSQCYLDINNPQFDTVAGNTNKMFVKAELMPKKIKITGIGVERIQDISDEDCIKEGILLNTKRIEFDEKKLYSFNKFKNSSVVDIFNFSSPREAYAALIDKISGKGTWASNPYVFAYEYELMK